MQVARWLPPGVCARRLLYLERKRAFVGVTFSPSPIDETKVSCSRHAVRVEAHVQGQEVKGKRKGKLIREVLLYMNRSLLR